MLLFRGVLVSLLLPIWAVVGLLTVGVVSYLVVAEEDPAAENVLTDLGIADGAPGALGTALTIVLLAGFALHLIAAVATSRAVAAMAGSIGGVIATVVAGLMAVAVTAAPDGQRTDALQTVTQPVAVAVIGVISLWFGFRAFLAHTGRWRYAKRSFADGDYGDYGDYGD